MIADKVMEFHEVVSIWPKMQEDEFAKLVADIKANGLKDAIWTYQGKIIDGRHRYLACQEAGVKPLYREWDGQGSLVMFVASLNQYRRHLDAGQKAFVAQEIEKRLTGEAKQNMSSGGSTHKGNQYTAIDPRHELKGFQNFENLPIEPIHAAKQAAKIAGSNHQYVVDAKKIQERAPELKALVMDRTISLPEAKKLAKEPEQVRQTVINKVATGKVKNVNSGLLEVKKEKVEAQAQAEPTKPHIALASYEEWLPLQPQCDVLITDPPYSTDIKNIDTFAQSWLPKALSKVKDSGRAYVCIGAYPRELQAYLNVHTPLPLRQVLVWAYKNTLGPSPTYDYKQNWQAILYYCGANALPLDHEIMNEMFSVQEINAPDGRIGNHYHEWQKPDELAERLIRHSTKHGDTVMDCFAGTGTFMLASHKLGRVALGCDISPEMLEIAYKRGCEVINGNAS